MKLKNYRNDFLKRLSNPKYDADYLRQTMASGDTAALVIAIRDVQDAGITTGCAPDMQTR